MEKRTIKFRAWDGLRMTTSGIMFNCSTGEIDLPQGANMKLMQFTGLLDKDGNEIYEGDLVKYALDNIEPENGQTEYIEDIAFLDGCFCLDNYTPVSVLNDWPCEVIGNIYENPELLTP